VQAYCVRKGQIEVGVISHEGREFAAFGATVNGHQMTAYTRFDNRQITLTTWCGKTILECRCEVVASYWSGTMALVFRLTNRRFIVGYALGNNGMLFRGELLTYADETDARRMARMISENFADLYAEDEDSFDQDE
jgi:hypothetical protein